jgi:hypothetical protein
MSVPEPVFPEAKQLKQNLADNIRDLIHDFEAKTQLCVCQDGIKLHRSGSTDCPPNTVRGVYIQVY